jgi:hypothetical protein
MVMEIHAQQTNLITDEPNEWKNSRRYEQCSFELRAMGMDINGPFCM